MGYTNETYGIYPASSENPVIIFDDFTTSFKWVNFPFKAKSSAMKMITPLEHAQIIFRYIYYAMKIINYKPGGHARQWIKNYSQIRIPVPPLEVQNAIVEILDTFTALQQELEAELEARKKQYEYYREEQLSFDDDEVEWKTLGEICEVKRGSRVTKRELDDNCSFPVYSGGVTPMGYLERSNQPANTVTVVKYGTAGFVNFVREEFWANDVCYCIKPLNQGELDNKFLFYSLKNKQSTIKSLSTPAIPAHLPTEVLSNYKIPIPSLEKQKEIVATLDQFDALVNDLSIGIPAEINARRLQLEYYQNKLLTFKEKP